MVAIVSGSGLGLFNGSRAVLGEQGSVGNATLGQGNERIYVNAATGNLVIQQTDEFLASSGLDLNLIRTYNSQGLVDGDNNDNWRLGARTWLQSIPSFSTPANLPNMAGSYVIRVGADGVEIRYNYDVARGLYVSTEGDGAHDTLIINTSTAEWTYTDGSSRVNEQYDINGRLLWTRDIDGNLTTYTYVGALLTQINTLRQDAAGNTTTQNQTTYIDYTASTSNVSQIRTVIDGVTQIRTSYTYDTSNRLSQVLVDLTPLDAIQTTVNANGLRVGINGQSYVTTYTYDGASKRVASISQSDGTIVNFTYEQTGSFRLKTVVDASGNTTTFNYNVNNIQTDVVALGLTTSYFYDSAKRLTEVRTPALAGGTYIATKYTYDNDGNVATVTDGRNTVTTYQYDANGNLVLSRDALGNTVTYTYNNNNQLLTESRYTAPDNDGAGSNLPSNALTTRYVYDAENHLRFLVSPEGRVTEYQYNAVGQRISEIQYTAGTYNVSALKSRDRSLDFDGVNDAVTFADPALGTGPLTIQAWVNADTLAGGTNSEGGRGILHSANNDAAGDYYLSVDANGAVHFAYWNAAGNNLTGRIYTANNTITAGKWYHIVASWDGTTRKIYVNGVLQTPAGSTSTNFGWGVERAIGRSWNGGDTSYQFDGKIDDVRLYTSALNQADITSLYGNDNATLTTTGAVLKARWKFDETSGVTAVNSVSTTLNGTLTNISDKAWATLVASALLESELTTWVGTQTKTNCIRTDYAYDFRGLLSKATTFNSVDANGNGITTDTNNSVTQYVYDQRGQLLQRVDPRSVANEVGAKVYDNSGNTANWSVYDAIPVGATITSVFDATRNKQVIQLTGDGGNNGYVLRQNGTANWNNTTQAALEWSQNFAGNFTIYIDVQTNLGHRYLTYVNGTAAPIPSGNGEYLTYSLGNVADGQWHTFRRDLQADMALLDPNAKIQSVNGMLVRGTGRIDGVIMRDKVSDYTTRYVYDGLGRLLSTTDALGNTTLNQYDAAQNRIVTTSANGVQTTTAYNARGLLISQAQASGGTTLGTTLYGYDALGRLRMVTDPTGVKTYALYDEASRKVADIDASGALTEYLYTANNQVYKTIRYATRLNSTQLASLSVVDASSMVAHVALGTVRPATNSTADQVTWKIYDTANRLLWSVESSDADPAQGYATQYFYDGAHRLTKSVRYSDPVTTSTIVATTISITAPTGSSRTTTYFYSNDGKLLGTLDADNFLTENKYNVAGQLTEVIRYNNARAGTTLSAARPAAHNDDQHTYNLYNAKGQLAGVLELGGAATGTLLNAEYYLTEYQYDVAGNVIQQTRYYDKSPITSYTTQSLSALRPTTNSSKNLVTLTTYNGANQVVTVTKNPEGTLTRYSYDNMGRLLRTDAAVFSTDLRTSQVKYDAYGRVIAELAGEGNAALAALVNPTQAQINTIWTQYGISHTYDAAGRRTVSTDQYGYKTFYYYDQANHLRFTIRQADDNGTTVSYAGEITEREYNALGQHTFTRRYASRISLTGLTGGLLNTTTQGQFTALRSTLTDRVEEAQYNLRGAVKAAIDALGKGTTYTYNGFGELTTQSSPVSAGQSLLQAYNYNNRGQVTTVSRSQGGSESRSYDAFGRVINVRDANNYYTNFTYDRLDAK